VSPKSSPELQPLHTSTPHWERGPSAPSPCSSPPQGQRGVTGGAARCHRAGGAQARGSPWQQLALRGGARRQLGSRTRACKESGCASTHQHPPRRLPLAGHRHPQPHVIDDGLVRLTWARKGHHEMGGPSPRPQSPPVPGGAFRGALGCSRTLQLDVEPLAVAGGGGEGAGVDGARPRAVRRLRISGGPHQQPGGQKWGVGDWGAVGPPAHCPPCHFGGAEPGRVPQGEGGGVGQWPGGTRRGRSCFPGARHALTPPDNGGQQTPTPISAAGRGGPLGRACTGLAASSLLPWHAGARVTAGSHRTAKGQTPTRGGDRLMDTLLAPSSPDPIPAWAHG